MKLDTPITRIPDVCDQKCAQFLNELEEEWHDEPFTNAIQSVALLQAAPASNGQAVSHAAASPLPAPANKPSSEADRHSVQDDGSVGYLAEVGEVAA